MITPFGVIIRGAVSPQLSYDDFNNLYNGLFIKSITNLSTNIFVRFELIYIILMLPCQVIMIKELKSLILIIIELILNLLFIKTITPLSGGVCHAQ